MSTASARLRENLGGIGKGAAPVGATKLANSLLANPTILSGVNTDLNLVSQITSGLSAITNPATAIGNDTAGGGIAITLGADPSAWLTEVQRIVTHTVSAQLAQAVGVSG